MISFGPYVPDERVYLWVQVNDGAPRELTLVRKSPSGAEDILTLADGDLVLNATRYEYSFVPTLTDVGIWSYRFYGVNSSGLEFACPPNQRWKKFEVK